MTKIFLISMNLIIVFALKIFFGGDVKVEQKMQETIKPGETLNVKLEITKGDREGFAKWQQTLPEGFIASSVEMNGATFSFKNQEIKVIWMELPATETFTIQYKIETSVSVIGEHNLGGKFSFIEENERRDINSEVFILTIDGELMAENKPEISQEDSTQVKEIVYAKESLSTEQTEASKTGKSLNNTAKNNSTNDKSLKNNSSDPIASIANSEVSVERNIRHIENGNYEVTLSFNKNGLKSFGKIEDFLPPNYSASEIESKEGIFSFKNNAVKILWMTLPEVQEFEVKYALQSTPDGLDSATIHGVFSYLDKDQSVQSNVAPTKLKNFLVQEQLADTGNENPSTANETESNDSENNEQEIMNTTQNLDASAQAANSTSEDLTKKITNIPAPEAAIAYKIQIAASHKEVNQQYFKERHNIKEPVAIEFHETWYKYTVGSFPVYKEARDKRNQVWAENNKINDAFVTAYNSGERISVQEALMISKQKWFK